MDREIAFLHDGVRPGRPQKFVPGLNLAPPVHQSDQNLHGLHGNARDLSLPQEHQRAGVKNERAELMKRHRWGPGWDYEAYEVLCL